VAPIPQAIARRAPLVTTKHFEKLTLTFDRSGILDSWVLENQKGVLHRE
jgi:hypothetical protein